MLVVYGYLELVSITPRGSNIFREAGNVITEGASLAMKNAWVLFLSYKILFSEENRGLSGDTSMVFV